MIRRYLEEVGAPSVIILMMDSYSTDMQEAGIREYPTKSAQV